MVASVPNEAACKSICLRTAECNVYTYYDDNELYEPQMCVLLSNSGMQQTALACDHCVTGPARCQAAQKCQAAVLTDGTTNQYVFAKSTSTATLVSREKDCFLDARALVIGGGGAYGSGANYAGGGSGYVEFGTFKLKVNETLNLEVGSEGEISSVGRDGQVLLLASAGHNSNSNGDGGDGFSGGGSRQATGGEDGGDGGSYSSYTGGRGSGLDLGSVNMTKFTLSPGKGGRVRTSYGGGGGGVIVNGEKPSGNEYQGEGFGGGSVYKYGGLPGCVLIEV